MQYRNVKTRQGTVRTAVAPNARQTFVPLPTVAAGQTAKIGSGNVPAVVATNARQTRVI